MTEDMNTTSEGREKILTAGLIALAQMALAEGHDLDEMLALLDGEAHTTMVEELARLEMI